MPALLEIKLEKDLASPTTDYFVICFPDCAPMGLFSSSVTYLLSENNNKDYLSYSICSCDNPFPHLAKYKIIIIEYLN